MKKFEVLIVDSTLRDGEQQPGLAFSIQDKVHMAKLLDDAGVSQIEAGTAAMQGDEKKAIKKIASMSRNCKISIWNRMNQLDIQHAIDCGADVIHFSVPTSDLHIFRKLKRDKRWIINKMSQCIDYSIKHGKEVHIGFEDASRAEVSYLTELQKISYNMGVNRLRYSDTVGILNPAKIKNDFSVLSNVNYIDWGIHAHNDLGMAVANSLTAAKVGIKYIDCTVLGIGERAGNCNLFNFTEALLHVYNKDIINQTHIKKLNSSKNTIEETLKRIIASNQKIVNKNLMNHCL